MDEGLVFWEVTVHGGLVSWEVTVIGGLVSRAGCYRV